MNNECRLRGIEFSTAYMKGKKLPRLLISFDDEKTYYPVATFKDEQTANWFMDVVSEALFAVAQASKADKVDVVRCRDCRHRDPEDHKCDCGEMERQGCPFPVDDDYFCKYGARRKWGDDDDQR